MTPDQDSGDQDFGLTRIGQIAVTVKDVERATEFYRDRLGMRFLFAAPNMAFFDCDGVRLMLAVPEKPEQGSSILYYRVDDARRAYEALNERGVEFDGEPHVVHRDERHELWMGGFRDSEGNQLAIMSEVPV